MNERSPRPRRLALAWVLGIAALLLIPVFIVGSFIWPLIRPSSYFVTTGFACVADADSAFVILDLMAPNDPMPMTARLSSVNVEGAILVGAIRVPAQVSPRDLGPSELRELVATEQTVRNILGRAAEEMSVVVQFDRLDEHADLRTVELQVGEGEPARWQSTDLDLLWVGSSCEPSS